MGITPFTSVPSRNMAAAEFDDASDSFFGQLPTFATELNAFGSSVDGAAQLVIAASASATSAIAMAGATKWVSGTAYAIGDARWSPATSLTYRRKTVGAGTTDPSADATNWAVVTNTVFGDADVSRCMFRDVGYKFVDKGDSGTVGQVVDFSAGTHQRVKATGAFALSFVNWPPVGNFGEVLVELVADGTARAITFPAGTNFLKFDGATTTTFSQTMITLQSAANAIDWLYFWTRDEGTTIHCKVVR